MYWKDVFVECQTFIVVGTLCFLFLAVIMFANIFKYTLWKLFLKSSEEIFSDEMEKLFDWIIRSFVPTMLLLALITLIIKSVFNF